MNAKRAKAIRRDITSVVKGTALYNPDDPRHSTVSYIPVKQVPVVDDKGNVTQHQRYQRKITGFRDLYQLAKSNFKKGSGPVGFHLEDTK